MGITIKECIFQMTLKNEKELTVDFLITIKGIGEKIADNVFCSSGNFKNFMEATPELFYGLKGISETKSREIIKYRDEVFDISESFEGNRERWILKKIENSFYKFLQKKREDILSLSWEQLKPNPYMAFLLKDSLGLDNVDDFVNFLVNQHIERSLVTSFGSLIENLAIYFCEGRARKSHVDVIKLVEGNILYGISVKSGPNTINRPGVQDISKKLDEWKGAYMEEHPGHTVRTALGLTYGRNPQQHSRHIEKLGHELFFGKNFWTLVSSGIALYPETVYLKIKETAELAVKSFGYNSLKDAVSLTVIRLKYEFTQQYCNREGKIDWDLILENNM